MRKLFMTCLLFLVLLVPAPAQQTADLALKLYAEAGPEVGCLLFEPEMVLFLAGHKPRTRYLNDVVSNSDVAVIERLNRVLEPLGSRLVLKDDSLYGESLVGLEGCVKRSGLDWVQPFDRASGWRGYDVWKAESRRKLDEDSLELVDFMYGNPDQVGRAGRFYRKDEIANSLTVTTAIRYSDFLMGENVNFRVAPEDAGAPEVSEAVERFNAELTAFYTNPEIRRVIGTPDFVEARRKRRGRLEYGATTEAWLRGEPRAYTTFEVTSHSGLTVGHEKLLISQVDELVKRLEKGETPGEVARWLYIEGARLGCAPVGQTHFRKWIWTGAYGKSPARRKLYDAVKEISPEYIHTLAADNLDSWLEGDSSDETTYVLLSHPDIKEAYQEIGAEKKERAREILSRSEDLLVRALSQEPPYAP